MESWTFQSLNDNLNIVFTWADEMKPCYPEVFPEKISLHHSRGMADASWEGFVQAIGEIETLINTDPLRMRKVFARSCIGNYVYNPDEYSGLMDYFEKNLNYRGSGISHFTTSDMGFIPTNEVGNEIWVEGKCVLMSSLGFTTFSEMYDALS